jgi:hypothetical protein
MLDISEAYLADLAYRSKPNERSVSRAVLRKLIAACCAASRERAEYLLQNVSNGSFDTQVLSQQEILLAGQFSLAYAEVDIDAYARAESSFVLTEKATHLGLEDGAHVWILTDRLGELAIPEIAEITASNLQRGVVYRYFVPQSIMNQQVALRESIEKHRQIPAPIRANLPELLFIELPETAFTCRLRIADPLGKNPTGVYSIGGSDARTAAVVSMPSDLVTYTRDLLARYLHAKTRQSELH